MEVCGDDLYNDKSLIDVLYNLRNIPVVEPSSPRKSQKKRDAKKRVQRARPKRLPEINLEFIVNPPHKFILMANGDSRISIPYTYMEAYSSGSPDKYRAMMNAVCDPNLIFLQHYDGKQNPYGPNERKIVGLQSVTDFWLTCMHSAPDMIPTIYEMPIGYRNEITDESFISVKVVCSMTKTSLVVDSQQMREIKTKDAIDLEVLDKDATREYKLVRLPDDVPLKTSYQCCKYTICLNSEHKITKLCMLFKVVLGEPSAVNKYSWD